MLKLKSISILSIFIILVLTILLISFPNVSFSALRAGVAKVNITKEKPTSLVNDPLFTRALVIDDGKTKAIIVTLDIGGVSEKLLSEVRELVKKNLRLDGNNILINASHNHRVHGQLADDYVNKIVTAIKKANENMVQVKIGAGKGMENRITMNRRLKLTNGKEWTIRHRLPCPPDEEVAGMAGPFDPEIGILRIDKTDGTPFAVLYNFGGHVYGGVPNGGVTACFPGFASSTIEEYLGNDVIAMFIQGAEGDITPTLFKDYNAPKPEVEHGTKLGLSTLKAVQNISTKKEGDLKVVREKFEFPHRTDVQMRIDSLEAEKKVISDYFRGIGCGALGRDTKLNFKAFLPLYIKYMMSADFPTDYSFRYIQENIIEKDDLVNLDKVNRRDIAKYLSNIYAMEKLIKIEEDLICLRRRTEQSPLNVEIIGIKIGDYILISYPGEIFAQVALNIKKNSPNKNTYIAGLSNGSVGYAPSADAYEGGSYEVTHTKLAPEWQKIYEDKAMEIINKLIGK